MAQPAIATSG